MTTYTFTPPKVTPMCWWRVDSSAGSDSVVAITPPAGGAPVLGLLRSDERGHLSKFRGPENVSSLVLKRMTKEIRGTVIPGFTVTLDIGVADPIDPGPVQPGGGVSQDDVDQSIASALSTFPGTYASQAQLAGAIGNLENIYSIQDDSVLNVQHPDFGAKGDNVTNDTAAIQAAFNACPPGGAVEFPVGVYRINAPLVLPPFVQMRGSYGMRGQANVLNAASDLGSRIRPLSTFTGTALIQMLDKEQGGYSVDNESSVISDITLDGSGKTTGTFSGILASGYVHGVRLNNVNISSVRGDGIGVADYVRADTTRKWPYSWHFDNVQVWAATNDGFALAKMTDCVLYGCRAIGVGGDGFQISNMANSTFTACRSEWSGNNGFYITGNWGAFTGSGGAIFVGTSTDRNTKNGVLIDATGASPLIFTGMNLRRDGRGPSNPPVGGQGYAAFKAASATMPVLVNGIGVYPGIDDTGIGANSPQYGVAITGSTYVAVTDGFLHADKAGWYADSTNTKVVRGVNVTERIGTPTSFTTIYSDSVAATAARVNPLRGIPIANNTNAIPEATARTTSGTHRNPHVIATAASDIRCTWVGWSNNALTFTPNYYDADSTGTMQIKASIEYSGAIYRLTFNGLTTGSIDGGGFLQSDPLAIDLPAGALIYVRTFVVAGSTWHYNRYSQTSLGGGGYVATTDLTAPGSGSVADSAGVLLAPAVITGRPLATVAPPSLLLIGDSIGSAAGDGVGVSAYQNRNTSYPQLSGGGFVARAIYGKYGYISATVPGDTATSFKANISHFRRMAFSSACSTMVCEYGRNDLSGGNSVATVQADLLTCWNLGLSRGLRVIQTTITVKTTSTDAWRSTVNQTFNTYESNRVAINTWLRAGAPIVAGAAVAIGTSNAIVMGQPGHPLYAVWEVANLVETAQNSGYWKTWDNTRTVVDGAINNGSNTFTSATAVFTDTDIGRMLAIPGAGAAGATLYCSIVTRYSATQCAVSLNGSTTVTGATVLIGDSYTYDGTHPAAYAHALMATGCDTTKVI